MRLPAMLKRNFLVYYLVLWGIFTLAYGSLLSWYHQPDSIAAWADSLITTLILFLIFSSVWFVIRFGKGKTVLSYVSVRNIIFAAVILLIVWHFLTEQLLLYLFQQQSGYLLIIKNWQVPKLIAGLGGASLICLSMISVSLLEEIREADKKERELKALVQQTELQALKNQLNPHFLYNSLNAISSLITTNPRSARDMVIRLSDFLRYALKQDAMKRTTLRKELESVEKYMQIESVRFGEKLSWQFQINKDHMDLLLPAMILQPLFENAVKHGVQQSDEPVQIQMSSSLSEHTIILSVSNGFDKLVRFRGEGVGLQNVRNRLRLIYGNGQLLHLQEKNQVFTASLRLPAEMAEANEAE